jgi:CRISPR-associated protein Cas1
MEPILNTLYVMTQGAYLHLDHETVKVEVEKELKLQVPLLHLGAIVVFGNVLVSPFLIHNMGQEGRTLVFMTQNGRFKARLSGPVSGNVLLRVEQYRRSADATLALPLAKWFVAGKAQNQRQLILRSARESSDQDAASQLRHAAEWMARRLPAIETAAALDETRGMEGEISRAYFEVFGKMIKVDGADFLFDGRNRRPPRDRMNALMSFLYAMLAGDCASAAEGVGLDPQAGFLHALRPGRFSLALDLMEEFRSSIADRLALALVNLRKINAADFTIHEGGGVSLNEDGRKKVVIAYQERKQEELTHPTLNRKIPLGLAAHLQARLLARHLRGDTERYDPFIPR